MVGGVAWNTPPLRPENPGLSMSIDPALEFATRQLPQDPDSKSPAPMRFGNVEGDGDVEELDTRVDDAMDEVSELEDTRGVSLDDVAEILEDSEVVGSNTALDASLNDDSVLDPSVLEVSGVEVTVPLGVTLNDAELEYSKVADSVLSTAVLLEASINEETPDFIALVEEDVDTAATVVEPVDSKALFDTDVTTDALTSEVLPDETDATAEVTEISERVEEELSIELEGVAKLPVLVDAIRDDELAAAAGAIVPPPASSFGTCEPASQTISCVRMMLPSPSTSKGWET